MSERDLELLERERFDLLVIGGGITGAALAWDASMRGLRVALIDQGDFGAATSAATSKLIHGGLRYLKQAELRLVRESLRERRILQGIAGHLVRPLPFLLPTYRQVNKRWQIRAGLMLYDLLGYDRTRLEDPEQRLPRHEMLSLEEATGREPELPTRDMTGAALYYDCRCEPERLTWEFILAATWRGAQVVNYARARDLLCRVGRLDAVEVEDRLSGRCHEVRARMVVNAAGPWADKLDNLCGASSGTVLKRSKGIHIVTRPLTRKHAVVLPTPEGRHLFIIPWRGHSLIGTTDTEYHGDPGNLGVDDDEVAAFVETVNAVFPAAKLNPAAVKYRYAGVRPLVDSDSQVYNTSRRYEIIDHHAQGTKGLITATGGKYTTSRNLARKIADLVLARLGEPQVACRTATTQLPGAVSGSFSDYLVTCLEENRGLLERERLRYLVETYGARHEEVLELIRADASLAEPIIPGRPECLAQVVFAVEHEWAQTLADVVFRRTGLATLGDPGDSALDRVAQLAGARLGWDSRRRREEVAACREKLHGRPERLAAEPSGQ